MKTHSELSILLVQSRKDALTLQEEHEAFATQAGVSKKQIDTVRVFEVDDYDYTHLDAYDAVFFGGSSNDEKALLCDNPPSFAKINIEIIRRAYEKKMPVFASCFGFQVATVALGGILEHDVSRKEFGTLPFTITKEGERDVLYKHTPNPFLAVVGHEKLATKLPVGAVCLVKTDICPYHSFTFPDRPFYAFQFHPELTTRQLIDWLTRYKDNYFSSEEEFARVVHGLHAVPYANALVRTFVDSIVLGIK